MQFYQGCGFQAATFEKTAVFSNTRFHVRALFHAAHFHAATSFGNAKWHCLPDFSDVLWQTRPDPRHFGNLLATLEGKRQPTINWHDDPERAADKFRALRLVAKAGEDHEREQAFFALELQAKRLSAYQRAARWKWWHEDAWEWLAYKLYDCFSDSGRSLKRPLTGFLLTFAISWFAVISLWFNPDHHQIEGCTTQLMRGNLYSLLIDGVSYTLSTMLPFIGASIQARSDLFPACAYPSLHLISYVSGLFSFIFLFLFGLALRNRFRM